MDMKHARAAVLGAATALALTASGARAADPGPFTDLAGAWTGTGTVSVSNGTQERIRCRASYSSPPSGQALHQELRCASDSYKFDVDANVLTDDAGQLSGTWSELSRQVTGSVSGRVSPGALQALVNGSVFSASLSVSTKGNRQTVIIKPAGTEIQSVNVDMRRS